MAIKTKTIKDPAGTKGLSTTRMATAALLLLLAGPLTAQEEEERDVLARVFGESIFERVEVHGFLSQGFLVSNRNRYLGTSDRGSFEFNEAGLRFDAQITDKLYAGVQIYSRDLGTWGNNEIKIDWALLRYHFQDELGIQVGKIKIPLGFYNETWDIDGLRTPILLPRSVYRESFRESIISLNGVGLYGNIDLGPAGGLEYRTVYGAPTLEKDGGIAEELSEGTSSLLEIDSVTAQSSAGCKLIYTPPLEGVTLAGSCVYANFEYEGTSTRASGPFPAGTDLKMEIEDIFMFVLSGQYEWENLTFTTEFSRLFGKSKLQVPSVANLNITKYYVEGFYFALNYVLNDWLEVGTYYSRSNDPYNDQAGHALEAQGRPGYKATNDDIALTAKFNLSEQLCFKVEYHQMRGTSILARGLNPDDGKEHWNLLALKVSINF